MTKIEQLAEKMIDKMIADVSNDMSTFGKIEAYGKVLGAISPYVYLERVKGTPKLQDQGT